MKIAEKIWPGLSGWPGWPSLPSLPSVVVALLVLLPSAAGAAAECRPAGAAISGEAGRYAVHARVDGSLMVFADIPCAVYWRNNELCATELSDFQFTAKVGDFTSGDEILMTAAHYVVGAPETAAPVAFADRSRAEAFIEQRGGGELLDFEQLVTHAF